jgi:hypothetical protein
MNTAGTLASASLEGLVARGKRRGGIRALSAAVCGAPAIPAQDPEQGEWEEDDTERQEEEEKEGGWEDVAHPTVALPRSGRGGSGGNPIVVSLEGDGVPVPAPRRRTAYSKADRETALAVHRSHLLCLLGRGLTLAAAADEPEVAALALSLPPVEVAEGLRDPGAASAESLIPAVAWFRDTFGVVRPEAAADVTLTAAAVGGGGVEAATARLVRAAEERRGAADDLVALFVALLQVHGLRARAVGALHPSPISPAGASSLDAS